MSFASLVTEAVSRRASDLHLAADHPPLARVDGALETLDDKPLSARAVETLIQEAVSDSQWKRFQTALELDAAYERSGQRLRLNLHYDRGTAALAARIIPLEIPSFEDIELPEAVQSAAHFPNGLVLITGPAGSGKSTTIASLLESINTSRAAHIVTLEDPIEYIFPMGKGLIKQREIGTDTSSFAEGLRHALRQDPDVIMVGEMRDPETIAAALTLAETGHLVFSTLHTSSAAQAVNRIVDSFTGSQQEQVRHQLSLSLRLVVSQALIPRQKGGLVAAREILVNTPGIANLIRENKIEQIGTAIQTGRAEGMVTLERAVTALVNDETISEEMATPYLATRSSRRR